VTCSTNCIAAVPRSNCAHSDMLMTKVATDTSSASQRPAGALPAGAARQSVERQHRQPPTIGSQTSTLSSGKFSI
jgi:hypothetical protein